MQADSVRVDQDHPRIYLAGAVHHAPDNGRGWRDEAVDYVDAYGAEAVDPLAKYDAAIGDVDWPPEQIVREDLALIRDCDGLLVAWDEETPTCGTPMEIFFARVTLDLPVVVVDPEDETEALSPWIRAHASSIHDRLEPAVQSVTDRAGGENGSDQRLPSGDEMAATLLQDTADLVSDDRDTHGDAVENQEHIAEAWQWYLSGHDLLGEHARLTGADVARMMQLLKLSRGAVGEYDVDHDRDTLGYGAIAAACEAWNGRVDPAALERGGGAGD